MAHRTTGKGFRLGIDLGGTKIEGVVLDRASRPVAGHRIPTPRLPDPEAAYRATLEAVADLVRHLEAKAGATASIGIGMPGSLAPKTGRVQNANSTWLNDQPFGQDLEHHLGRQVRLANDANCFALSEATDGAGAGARSVLGVILGTGCGSGLVIDGRILDGPRGIGGEWGHNPLPWSHPDEHPGATCWCGRKGCMETWVSGPALAADYRRHTGVALTGEDIAVQARTGEAEAIAALERHASRLARGLAHVVNIVDPEVIVLGGGLSGLSHLYRDLPGLMAPYVFAEALDIIVRPPRWGDASGVRGAAWLWPLDGPDGA